MFEILKTDLAGRIGKIQTNHGTVETPAYVPVIHPVKQTIPCKKIRDIGFDLVITNAYISKKYYGTEAIKKGIHKIIDYDGSIMTDSGGYQVLEYGDVDATPSEIQHFETDILTDFAIPLDKPTGFGLSKNKAKSYVDHTLRIAKLTLEKSKKNGQIWIGPIQGGEHFDLVKRSTRNLVNYGYKMLALGSPVEFMESYEYKLLAQMIISAKKEIPYSIPLHLFGAGHPLTISFAVALGCDTFDSASYMLYAKKGRYITEDGTRYLENIKVFPCNCEICTKYSPKELIQLDENEKINELALHNLYAIKEEVDKVKQAIYEGRLWEYVMKKCRAHPRLYEVIDILTNNSDFISECTPKFKEKALFLYSIHDQFRPEVQSFHRLVRKFKSKKGVLVISKETKTRPAYLSKEYHSLKEKFDPRKIQVCQYNPVLGLIPLEISDIYPAAHHETARISFKPKDFEAFEKTWIEFFKNNSFDLVYYDKKDPFLKHFAKSIPKRTRKKNLK